MKLLYINLQGNLAELHLVQLSWEVWCPKLVKLEWCLEIHLDWLSCLVNFDDLEATSPFLLLQQVRGHSRDFDGENKVSVLLQRGHPQRESHLGFLSDFSQECLLRVEDTRQEFAELNVFLSKLELNPGTGAGAFLQPSHLDKGYHRRLCMQVCCLLWRKMSVLDYAW